MHIECFESATAEKSKVEHKKDVQKRGRRGGGGGGEKGGGGGMKWRGGQRGSKPAYETSA